MESVRNVKGSWPKWPQPKLRFSPTAYAKLQFLRDYGGTEVGGFGVVSTRDPLYVMDFRLVRQVCSTVSVRFEDDAVADYFDDMVDEGYVPESFGRIWLHTHPGDDPTPSLQDEVTFERCFGATDWAVMAILSQDGSIYARLKFNVGPGGSIEIPAEICFERSFPASDFVAWEQEYIASVQKEPTPRKSDSAETLAEPDPCHLEDWPHPFDPYVFEETPCPIPSDTPVKRTSSRGRRSST